MSSIGTVSFLPNKLKHKAYRLVLCALKINVFLLIDLHLSDAFIQSDLYNSGYTFVLSVYVFPGNRTHNICVTNARGIRHARGISIAQFFWNLAFVSVNTFNFLLQVILSLMCLVYWPKQLLPCPTEWVCLIMLEDIIDPGLGIKA